MLVTSQLLLRCKSWLRTRCPSLLVVTQRIAAETVMFRDERRYLKGKRETDSHLSSVLFFASIRSASQHVSEIIARLYREAGGASLNLSRLDFFRGRQMEGAVLSEKEAEQRFVSQGYYFGVCRPIEPSADLSDFKKVFIFRDPRDIMVSFYYSLAYAHSPSDAKFARDAKEAREKGIEWFVHQPRRLKMVGEQLRKMRDLTNQYPNSLVIKYEDMMADFEGFLKDLARYMGIEEETQKLQAAIVAEHQSELQRKSTNLAHRRAGNWGQFEDKLSPETVDFLNKEFEDLLAHFDYPISVAG